MYSKEKGEEKKEEQGQTDGHCSRKDRNAKIAINNT
jgi:hypothetical protein